MVMMPMLTTKSIYAHSNPGDGLDLAIVHELNPVIQVTFPLELHAPSPHRLQVGLHFDLSANKSSA